MNTSNRKYKTTAANSTATTSHQAAASSCNANALPLTHRVNSNGESSLRNGLTASNSNHHHHSNNSSKSCYLRVFGLLALMIVLGQVSLFIHTHNEAFLPHLHNPLESAPPEYDVRSAMRYAAGIVDQMKNDLNQLLLLAADSNSGGSPNENDNDEQDEQQQVTVPTTTIAMNQELISAIRSTVRIASDELVSLGGKFDEEAFQDVATRDDYDSLLSGMIDVAAVIHDLMNPPPLDGDDDSKKERTKKQKDGNKDNNEQDLDEEEDEKKTMMRALSLTLPDDFKDALAGLGDAIGSFRSDSFEKRFHYYDTTNPSAAWRGEVDVEQWELQSVNKLHMVVAHCDKDLGWLSQFTRGRVRGRNRSIESLTIFSKCGNPVTSIPRYAKVITMDNVGRCDHTYAHWMANYAADEKLQDNDVVFFVKDNPYQTRHGHWKTFNNMLGAVSRNGFSCALRPNYMWPIRELEPSTFHLWDLIKTFGYKETYQRQGGQKFNKKASRGAWGVNDQVEKKKVEVKVVDDEKEKEKKPVESFVSKYRDLQDWSNAMGIEDPEMFTPVCYGGVFATSVGQIRKRLDTLRSIEKSLSRADNLEEGHFAERSWARLLTKPLSSDGLLDIAARVDDAPCRNYPIEGYRQYWKDRCGTLLHNRNLHPEMHKENYESNKSISTER